jgi:hypothetical protein
MHDVNAKPAKNASQRKPHKGSNEQIALHLCYGQIGISAVAAAARYQGDSKNSAKNQDAVRSDEYAAAIG